MEAREGGKDLLRNSPGRHSTALYHTTPLAQRGEGSNKAVPRQTEARITRSRAVSPRRPNSLHFSRPKEESRVGISFGRPIPLESSLQGLEWIGGCRGDALAEMPSVKPRAQLAFKNSMIRGILQFTLRIAFRCVLHRCKSQDIRC